MHTVYWDICNTALDSSFISPFDGLSLVRICYIYAQIAVIGLWAVWSLKASNSSVLVTSVPINSERGFPLWDRLIDFMWPRQEAPYAATEQQRSREWALSQAQSPHFLPTFLACFSWITKCLSCPIVSFFFIIFFIEEAVLSSSSQVRI